MATAVVDAGTGAGGELGAHKTRPAARRAIWSPTSVLTLACAEPTKLGRHATVSGPRRVKAVRPPHKAHGQEAGSTPHTAKSTQMARYYEQASVASYNSKYR